MAIKFHIGMVLFDGMTNLDLAGPADMLARIPEAEISLIAPTDAPITTDSDKRILPDMAFGDAPALDMLFVPGGPATTQLMEDGTMLSFLREQGAQARYVTSVCTGALLLGAAGLLDGYRAVTHWTVMDLLPLFGAQPVAARVVIDRNRITGAGVTAGMDFALTLIAHLWGEERAQLIQLGTEYDPKPPFDAGSPATAPEAIVDQFRTRAAKMIEARREAAKRMAVRRG